MAQLTWPKSGNTQPNRLTHRHKALSPDIAASGWLASRRLAPAAGDPDPAYASAGGRSTPAPAAMMAVSTTTTTNDTVSEDSRAMPPMMPGVTSPLP